jgi:hypothetical protein
MVNVVVVIDGVVDMPRRRGESVSPLPRKGILISHGLISQLMFRCTIVSYKENIAIFRNRICSVKRQIFEENESPDEVETGEDLLGLDAKIPGGQFEI